MLGTPIRMIWRGKALKDVGRGVAKGELANPRNVGSQSRQTEE